MAAAALAEMVERHESRRVDNQLRGRAGRQGDPGASRFYLSLEDDLMRIFAREWVSTLLQSLGMEEGVPIESRMISRRIEAAQKAVETQNFESRKHVLEYDDVMNKQREAVYGLRRQLMEGVDQKQLITEDYTGTILSNILDEHAPEKASTPTQWRFDKLFAEQLHDIFGATFTHAGSSNESSLLSSRSEAEASASPAPPTIPLDPALSRHDLGDNHLRARSAHATTSRSSILSPTQMRYHERIVMLSVLDGLWKDHLLAMDHLKEGIGLRGYAQQDPLVAYKKESFEMFEAMMMRFQEDTARHLFRMQILAPDGTPIETEAQFAALQSGALPQRTIDAPAPGFSPRNQPPSGEVAPPPARTQQSAPTTTIDALEKEFERKKQRDLDAARMAGGSTSNGSSTPHTAGPKIGRNDVCFCGSGKKYKKCHGANA